MKVEQVKETFTPIKLEITIETEAEFWDLYHRINEAAGEINKRLGGSKNLANPSTSRPLFDVLDKISQPLIFQ